LASFSACRWVAAMRAIRSASSLLGYFLLKSQNSPVGSSASGDETSVPQFQDKTVRP
jgi:hypothetical protein